MRDEHNESNHRVGPVLDGLIRVAAAVLAIFTLHVCSIVDLDIFDPKKRTLAASLVATGGITVAVALFGAGLVKYRILVGITALLAILPMLAIILEMAGI
jgi:hypothetical protein